MSHRNASVHGSVTEGGDDPVGLTKSGMGHHSHRQEIMQSEVLDKQNKLNMLNMNRINRYRQEYLQGAGLTFDYTKGNSTTKNSIFGQFGTLADQSISINSTKSRGGVALTQRDSMSLIKDKDNYMKGQMESLNHPKNSLIFIETDRSRESLRKPYAQNLAVNKSLNFETL